MNTVTVKGKVYQVDALYSDGDGEVGRLKKASQDHDYPFVLRFNEANGERTKPCKDLYEIQSPRGVIKDAPIEPENNNWYMCEDHKGRSAVLHYINDGWLDSRGQTVTSVAALYKMVKA